MLRKLLLFAGPLIAALLLVSPAHAEWRRAESVNFILYGDQSEAALRARLLQLEDFDRLLRMLTAVDEPPAANKLPIYIVSGHRELDAIRDLPPGTAGFYTATPFGIAAFVDSSAEAGGNVLLFHEYAHHFLLKTGAAYPAWYVEGFAEYFSTVRFSAGAIDIGLLYEGRADTVLNGVWLPVERLLSGGTDGLSEEQVSAFYAQSWVLVHYFYSNQERQAALGRLLVALRRQPPAEALRSATGLTFETLGTELRRYVAGGRVTYRHMTRASAAASPAVTVMPLPPSAADMMLFEAALRIGPPAGDGADFLRRVREAAARHPDDPLAMRVLAHAELLRGDAAVADRLLDRLLAAAPGDAELLYLKGMRYLIAAENNRPPEDAAALARQWFTRAFAANPNHFQTLYRFVESLRREPEFLSDNSRNAFLLAHRLAPQVSEITMNAAILLMMRGEYRDAIILLRPIAETPHDSGLARRARRMIGEAEARRQPAGPGLGEATPH